MTDKGIEDILKEAEEPGVGTETGADIPQDEASPASESMQSGADIPPLEEGKEGEPPSPENEPGKEESPPSGDDFDGKVKAFQRTAEDERRKRQDIETRLAEREQQLAEYYAYVQQLNQQQPQQRQDEFIDPEGINFVLSQVNEAREADRRDMAQKLWNDRVNQSQFFMRQSHEDYDEVEKIFIEEANKNPALAQEMATSPMPAQFAYETGQKLKLMREIGSDPKAYEEAIRKKILAEMEANPPSVPGSQPQAPTSKPPQSLAQVPSTTPRDMNKVYDGPAPLDEILK